MEGLPKKTFKNVEGGIEREKTGNFVECEDENGEMIEVPERVAYDEERLLEGAGELNETQERDLRAALGDLLERDPDVSTEVAKNLKKKVA